MTIETTSGLLARLKAAQVWFENHGIDWKAGRIAEYEKILVEAEESRKAENPARWPHDRMRALFAAGCEIFDFIEISELTGDVVKGHRDKLAAVVKGALFMMKWPSVKTPRVAILHSSYSQPSVCSARGRRHTSTTRRMFVPTSRTFAC